MRTCTGGGGEEGLTSLRSRLHQEVAESTSKTNSSESTCSVPLGPRDSRQNNGWLLWRFPPSTSECPAVVLVDRIMLGPRRKTPGVTRDTDKYPPPIIALRSFLAVVVNFALFWPHSPPAPGTPTRGHRP